MMMSVNVKMPVMRARDFKKNAAYYPEIRPGYVGWVNPFPLDNGDVGLAFNEIRKAPNPGFSPTPLEAVEDRLMHYRFMPSLLPNADPDQVIETVYLRSRDQGRSWESMGRCPAPYRHVYHAEFPGGRLVRAYHAGDIWKDVSVEKRWRIGVDQSFDGGNTWENLAGIIPGHGFLIYRMRKLRKGTLILSGAITPPFGRGTTGLQSNSGLPGQQLMPMLCFFASDDEGRSWTGPHYLSGGDHHECDWVELEDEGLLFIMGSVPGQQPMRQIVRRCATGWINEPMMEIRSGPPETREDVPEGIITPETLVRIGDGLLIGARRHRPYICSNDLGENWYEIEGLPTAEYQPMMMPLSDGKVLSAWHPGGDTALGEVDMFIGTHSFGVEGSLPQVTRLTLDRELSADGSRYINAFRAQLTSGGTALSDREITFRVRTGWLPQPGGSSNPVGVWDSPIGCTAVTDETGTARFVLQDKEVIPDLHHAYQIAASFNPAEGDYAAECKAPTRGAYSLVQMRNNPAPYPAYLNHGVVTITPEAAERFPDLPEVVEAFAVPDPDTGIDRWIKAAGSLARAEEILTFLMENNIVHKDDEGIYHWYRSVHSGGEGEPWITEVRVCHIKEYCV